MGFAPVSGRIDGWMTLFGAVARSLAWFGCALSMGCHSDIAYRVKGPKAL